MVSAFCRLFEGKVNAIPHPDVNWEGFITTVSDATQAEPGVWDPIKDKVHPWVRVEKLAKLYHGESGGRCVVM